MASTIHVDGTQHWAGKAPSLSNGKWLKRALGAAPNRDRSTGTLAADRALRPSPNGPDRMRWVAPAPPASNVPKCSCHELLGKEPPNDSKDCRSGFGHGRFSSALHFGERPRDLQQGDQTREAAGVL